MRIITRRRVKVRVTVRRGDGSVTSHGWAYHRKREDEENDRKRSDEQDDSGETIVEPGGTTVEPNSPSENYDSVCDDKDFNIELEEDADYEDRNDESVYESIDKDSDKLYEEVGKKGLRVRFEGEGEGEASQDGCSGSLHLTGAIPKRGKACPEEEEKESEEMEHNGDSNEEGGLYESIEEVHSTPEGVEVVKTDTTENKSETYVYNYDTPRKIEVTVTSDRQGSGGGGARKGKEENKPKKRGKVEVKFEPWQTEGSGKRTKVEHCRKDDDEGDEGGDGNVHVEQSTRFSYYDKDRSRHQKGGSRSSSPYCVRHCSNIKVSTENLDLKENGESPLGEKTKTEKTKTSESRGRKDDEENDGDVNAEDFDGDGEGEEETYQRGRRRVKKRTLIRVRGVGVERDEDLDAAHAMVRSFSKTVVTFGRGLFEHI